MFYFNFIAIYLLLGRCSPQVHCLVATLFLSLILRCLFIAKYFNPNIILYSTIGVGIYIVIVYFT